MKFLEEKHAAQLVADKKWRVAHPGRRAAVVKKSRQKNPQPYREASARWYRAHPEHYAAKIAITNTLKAHPCMDCGGSFPPECMDFDHRPDTIKLGTIGTNTWKNAEWIKKEVAKCDLVCANCHRIRTKKRGHK